MGYAGVDRPHYLGPTIVATKDRPVRILFRNLLPTGVAGNLFLPVDTSLMGAGMGPNMITLGPGGVPNETAVDNQSVLDGVRNPECGQLTRHPTSPRAASPRIARPSTSTAASRRGSVTAPRTSGPRRPARTRTIPKA